MHSPPTKGKLPFSRRVALEVTAPPAGLVTVARVMAVRDVTARVMTVGEPMALQVADQADLTGAVPTGVAPAVSGADPMVLQVVLAPADLMVDPVVVPEVPVVPMVRAAAVQTVVPALVDPAVPADLPVVLAVLVAAAKGVVSVLVSPVDAGALSSGWIRLTASSTKSSGRLSL